MQSKCKVQNGGKVFGNLKFIHRPINNETKGNARNKLLYINIRLTVCLRRVYEGDTRSEAYAFEQNQIL